VTQPLPLESIDPRTFMTRAQVAEALTSCGFRVHPSTLASKASSRGGSPPFRKFGKTPMYLWGDVVEWVTQRMGEAACRHGDGRPERSKMIDSRPIYSSVRRGVNL
jgi:hypothetical protein